MLWTLSVYQSLRRVSWKSTGDCVRNATKSPKIDYSAMVREVRTVYREYGAVYIHMYMSS